MSYTDSNNQVSVTSQNDTAPGARCALVTGATSGIGRAIADRLLADGYTVYGIGRNESGAPLHANFRFLPVDLTDVHAIEREVRPLASEFSLLVNAAGAAYYGPHETITPQAIAEMTAVNVAAPMILAGLLLPHLRECAGTILNVSSVTARSSANTHGCAYGATKAALTSFSASLFEESRKHGVRVITIHPDLTDTALYRNADFSPKDDPKYRLTAEEVADCAMQALTVRDGMVVTDITVRPQRNGIARRDS
ncbi:MAG: SDR family NAD(P)-dependent oxidoreductase [Lachnospiraceae bacterium]|nr:SDR family NAD(P)-dependent oxidoreductase [Lachnospiraceae bacterium]